MLLGARRLQGGDFWYAKVMMQPFRPESFGGDKFQKTTLENVLPGPTATSLLPILVFLRSGKRMMSSHAAHKARMDRVTHIHRPCEDNKPWQCRQQLPADSRGRAHLRPMLLDM